MNPRPSIQLGVLPHATISPCVTASMPSFVVALSSDSMRKLGPVQTKDDQVIRSVFGGVLVQGRDTSPETDVESKIVTTRKPTPAELRAMLFGWKVVKHVKSNAIVYAAEDRTLGIGAGQMSRVDSSRIAIWKAKDAGLDLPERPHPSDLDGRLVNVFLKCEASADGEVRGRRNAMLDDSDVHWHRQIKACVGGVTAAVTGDPAVFVSVSAAHQGPDGGGPVAAIVDLG